MHETPTRATSSADADLSAASSVGTIVQRKLSIGAENDPLEREADTMADMVMRKPVGTSIQRKCTGCEEEDKKLQRKSITPFIQAKGSGTMVADSGISSQIANTAGKGSPLSAPAKTFMEDRFERDFSNVNIHTGDYSVQLNRQLNAQAFTVGNNIYFNEGKYAPESESGKHLLAHELTHTLQQSKIIYRKKCNSTTKAADVIKSHTVDKTIIEKPGDKVTFTVILNCTPVDIVPTALVDNSTNKEFSQENIDLKGATAFKKEWDGKKYFTNVGSYIEDGEYIHKLNPIKYAYLHGKDLKTSTHKSPSVTVKVKSSIGSSGELQHNTPENIKHLAIIIVSEMEEGNQKEKETIAWCVRNQMYRLNTMDILNAKSAFHDAYDKSKTNANAIKIATDILSKPMSDDFTSGAIKWFSPKRMPGKETTGYDCGGGIHVITDFESKKNASRCFPAFSKSMTEVTISGVREWFLKIYKL